MIPARDQQIGGLIMWVPMCLVYLCAIFGQLARWYSVPAETRALEPIVLMLMEPKPKQLETAAARALPHPTYFPAGMAMGVTFFFWGLITSWVIVAVGLGLFIAALAGWITDIRHERKDTNNPEPEPASETSRTCPRAAA